MSFPLGVQSYLEYVTDNDHESSVMLSENPKISESYQRKSHERAIVNSKQTQGPVIPWMVWLVMKVTCVFHEKDVVGPRKCFHCQIADSKRLQTFSNSVDVTKCFPRNIDMVGQGYDGREGLTNHHHVENANCEYCNSFWWNYEGVVCKYTDDDIGSRFWNHSGSWIISVIFLFLISLWNIYEISTYARYQKPQPSRFVHLLSYSIFLAGLSLYPVLTLWSKIKSSTLKKGNSGINVSWSTTLNARFIVKRLQFINFRRKGVPGKKFLFICFAWPIKLCIHRILIYSVLCENKRGFPYDRIQSLICTLILMIVWSNFQYLMYLCRVSISSQFRLVGIFIERHQTDLNVCRQILWSAIYDFNCYRSLVYLYMMVVFPLSTWATTTLVCWQYNDRQNRSDCVHVLWMIWSQIFMFLGISLFSTGGLDASYIWDSFRQQILSVERNTNSQKFWQRVTLQMDDLCVESSRVSWTMILSFITGFIALYSTELEMTGNE